MASDPPRMAFAHCHTTTVTPVYHVERYRKRAARYGAAAQGLLDALDPLIVTDPEGEAGADLARFDAAVSYLRRLLDDPPGREDR